MQNRSLFWQLIGLHTPRYQPNPTPHCFIRGAVLSQTSGESRTSECSPPAPGHLPPLVSYSSICLLRGRGRYFSSHQWVVLPCLPCVSVMGHLVWLPWYRKTVRRLFSPQKGVNLQGAFVVLSFCPIIGNCWASHLGWLSKSEMRLKNWREMLLPAVGTTVWELLSKPTETDLPPGAG